MPHVMSGAAHSDDMLLARVRMLDIHSDHNRKHTQRVVEAEAITRSFLPPQQHPPSGAQSAANGVPQAHGAARGRHHPPPQARDQHAGCFANAPHVIHTSSTVHQSLLQELRTQRWATYGGRSSDGARLGWAGRSKPGRARTGLAGPGRAGPGPGLGGPGQTGPGRAWTGQAGPGQAMLHQARPG